MSRAIGILTLNNNNEVLEQLTDVRPLGAVPFGGRYRLIDFTLSFMVNAGVRNVGIVTPYHYRPLLDHLGAGKAWALDRKSEGLFILPGGNQGLRPRQWHFPLRDLHRSIEFLEKTSKEDVIFSEANFAANIDLAKVLDFHNKEGNDVTLISTKDPSVHGETRSLLRLSVAGKKKVTGWWEYGQEQDAASSKKASNFYVGMGIIKRQQLIDIIGSSPFAINMDLFDILAENLDTLKVGVYEHQGYYGKICSVLTYFNNNMALLDPSVRQELFTPDNPIHTKVMDNPPTRYRYKAMVSNSLVSSGSLIDGMVEGSVISRDVLIQEKAELRNCIVMHKTQIGKNAKLENVILDKYVKINDNVVLKGKPEKPVIVGKYSVI
ncbi:MAG: glucose-1-phosphate adenylyltransferase subunit GlgD [Coriobacteriia bacterium]|nr:glucose-1-phosphate adenylyltransferase subunit GlgD [Coriobacteriia bacterium]MCL2751003.1 glucose-1-phosphate adenylyltransferase subunit GlgD [Coriobacteriia bacterium]